MKYVGALFLAVLIAVGFTGQAFAKDHVFRAGAKVTDLEPVNFDKPTVQTSKSTCCWFLAVVEGLRKAGFIAEKFAGAQVDKITAAYSFTGLGGGVSGTFQKKTSQLPRWQRVFQKWVKEKAVPTHDCYKPGSDDAFQDSFLGGGSACTQSKQEDFISKVYTAMGGAGVTFARGLNKENMPTFIKGYKNNVPQVPGIVLTATKAGTDGENHELTLYKVGSKGISLTTYNGVLKTETNTWKCENECKTPNSYLKYGAAYTFS